MAATVVGTTAVAAAMPLAAHPDAVLIAAWAAYKAAVDANNQISSATHSVDHDKHYEDLWQNGLIIQQTQAKTMVGVAICISYLLCEHSPTLPILDAMFRGKELPHGHMDDDDFIAHTLFDLANNVRALAVDGRV